MTPTLGGLLASVTLAGLLVSGTPARADDCHHVHISGSLTTLEIIGHDDQPICFAFHKIRGTGVIVSARNVENAARGEVNVTTPAADGSATDIDKEDSLEMPQAFGGARVLPRIDDEPVLHVEVVPRHTRGFKLALLVHQVALDTMFREMARNVALNFAIELFAGSTIKENVPLLGNPLVGIALKAAKTYARSETEAQFIEELMIALALDGSMRAADVPPGLRILVNSFVMTAVREMSRGAVAPYHWSGVSAYVTGKTPEQHDADRAAAFAALLQSITAK